MGNKIKSYTVIIPTYTPVAIFVTYEMAFRFCELSYGRDWERVGIKIEKTTPEHIKIIKG